MYYIPIIKNYIIAITIAVGLVFGAIIFFAHIDPVEAKSQLQDGCQEFSQTGIIIIYRCYDEKTNLLMYTNSVGFISKPEN